MKTKIIYSMSTKISALFILFCSLCGVASNAQPNFYTKLSQVWVNNDWQNSKLETNIYILDELTQTLRQHWILAISVWENDTRTFYTNTGGNVTEVISQDWDHRTGQWNNTQRLLYTYTPSNKVQTILIQSWVNGGWLNISQVLNSYTNNFVTTTVYQTWNFTSSAWQNTVQNLYTNNPAGFPTAEVNQLWDNVTNAWVNNLRYSRTFDNANNELTSISESWVPSTSQWMNTQRITKTYNESNSIATATTEIWLNNSWINTTMKTNTYDSNNFLTGTIFQSYSMPTTTWINTSQTINTNNADGTPSKILFKAWNGTTAAWENVELVIYTYVPLAVRNFINSNLFSIYPNPTTEYLHLNNKNNSAVDKIVISDLLGKAILHQEANVQTVDVQNLPQGSYVMKIYSQGSSYSYKFIRK